MVVSSGGEQVTQLFTPEIEHFLKGEAGAFSYMADDMMDSLIEECDSIIALFETEKLTEDQED